MLLPVYCIETLKHVLAQLKIPIDSTFPLRDTRYITDLAHELVQLLIISVMPNIWLCDDTTALRIRNDLKELFNLMGEAMEYLRSYSITDHLRITYLQLATTTMKLLSSIVPLELANVVISNNLKVFIRGAIMDAPMSLLHPSLHSLLLEYARVRDDSYSRARPLIPSIRSFIFTDYHYSRTIFSNFIGIPR